MSTPTDDPAQYLGEPMSDYPAPGENVWNERGVIAAVQRALAAQQQAVMAERERCAKLCDDKYLQHWDSQLPREASTARALARAIRSTPPSQQEPGK